MKWFKKKKEEEVVRKPSRINFDNIKMKMTIRSLCYFELLADKSFFAVDMDSDDVIELLYAMIVTNNDMSLSYNAFRSMLEDGRVLKWCYEQLNNIKKQAEQISFKKREETGEEMPNDTPVKMTDIAMFLIAKHHIDPKYVMDEMNMWELSSLVFACSKDTEESLTLQRLWTYLTILPNVDGKKIGGPEKLLPFPWDKENEKSKEKQLEKNAKAALSFLGGKKDGEG